MWVYVIKSIRCDWYYVGMSSNVERRHGEHNRGYVKSTKARKPYILIYKTEVSNRREGRRLEKKLKGGYTKSKVVKKWVHSSAGTCLSATSRQGAVLKLC